MIKNHSWRTFVAILSMLVLTACSSSKSSIEGTETAASEAALSEEETETEPVLTEEEKIHALETMEVPSPPTLRSLYPYFEKSTFCSERDITVQVSPKIEVDEELVDAQIANILTAYQAESEEVTNADDSSQSTAALPELTDQWVKDHAEELGSSASDVASFRAEQKALLQVQVDYQYNSAIQQDALQQLVDQSEIVIPDEMQQYAEAYVLSRAVQLLNEEGYSLSEYLKARDISVDAFKNEMKPGATEYAKQKMVIALWAYGYNIYANDVTLRALVKDLNVLSGQQYTMIQYIEKYGKDAMKEEAVNKAVLNLIQKSVTIEGETAATGEASSMDAASESASSAADSSYDFSMSAQNSYDSDYDHEDVSTSKTSSSYSNPYQSYDWGYDDVYDDGDYDDDRYARDPEYASGVDDAMDDYEEYGEDW